MGSARAASCDPSWVSGYAAPPCAKANLPVDVTVADSAPSFKDRRPASARASAAARGASRKTDTRCEVKLRSLLWRAGARFRKDVPSLPGRPDIVFRQARLIVFCDGDFWHGNCWSSRREKLARGVNAEYWVGKIEANMARDRLQTAQLEASGWTVLRIWESAIHAAPMAIARDILGTLEALTRRPRKA
jgi:DNA mismatch endonuclease (patch repair protein)